MIQSPDDPMIQFPSILALSCQKHSGIQLHSSQNDNVVLFSVVRAASGNESNLLIFKHLQKDYRDFHKCLWKSFFGVPVVEQFMTEQFITKNG